MSGEKAGMTVPAHHLVGMDLSFTCTNCGGHTSITPPCIPARTYDTPTPVPSEVAETTADERCPGCDSVVSARFQTCRPVSVDVTQVGYRYLAGTWGYCLHLGRDIKTTETPLLDRVRREEGERIAQAIEAKYLGPDSGRGYDGSEAPDAHCRNAYDEGLHDAATIARAASVGRGEGL